MPLTLAKLIVRYHLPLPSGWWLELWCSLTLVVWAKWSFWLGENISRESNYRYISEVLSDDQVEAIGFLLGITQVIICLFFKEIRILRIVACLGPSTFIFAMTWGLFRANSGLPGIPAYFSWGLMDIMALCLLCRKHHI